MTPEELDRLADACGIGREYHDFRGELRRFHARTRRALLDAMGADETPAPADGPTTNLRAVEVLQAGQAAVIDIAIPATSPAGAVSWTLHLESGGTRTGDGVPGLPTGPPPDGEASPTIRCRLPADLPEGYHRLLVAAGARTLGEVPVIVAPRTCCLPPALASRRVFGITVQLYTLRSRTQWGIGDFGDLLELVELAAPLGCDLIGLNPLHALFPASPADCSPYSPSSRQFLNVLYIDMEQAPGFADCTALADYLAAGGRGELDSLRATAHVDYTGVARVKLHWLQRLHRQFHDRERDGETQDGTEFRSFLAAGGEALRLHALFDALHAHLEGTQPGRGGWPGWPEAYRQPRSAEVARFAAAHALDIEFHAWLQWVAARQLARVQARARQLGMAIGLYGDVAVGVNAGGSETWANQSLYVMGAAIGAPPDPLALKGQDWGIPPQSPQRLRAEAYVPFIALLRANMQHAGALRLDHVMALHREWWVPRGFPAVEGAYVHYPLDDLMRILCLESHRHGCFVIGEDLGTVPDEVRIAMREHAVAHYKVVLFERTADGGFRAPSDYEPHSIAAVTTHDLPTFRGWWEGADIRTADRLSLYPDRQTRDQVAAARDTDRRRFMEALVGAGLWYWQSHEPLPECSHALLRAAHLYVSLSAARIAVVQLEDLALMSDPVNIPGTHVEHANWQRKMAVSAAELLAGSGSREMLQAMGIARTGRNPN